MAKIAFIGAGGRVSTTALAQFARFEESASLEFVLYDKDEDASRDSLEVFRRGVEIEGCKADATIVSSLDAALRNADFVMYCAINPDSDVPPYNLKGELGNIDAMIKLVEKSMDLCAPGYRVINYANPTDLLGMILRRKFPDVDIQTLCTGAEEFRRNLMYLFDIPWEQEDRLVLRHVGGNHFGFVVSCTVDGKDIMPELRALELDWRSFQGLRHGDAYDLARTLSLYRASGILTLPSGHIAYYHGVEGNPGHPSDHGHFRPTKDYIVNISKDPDTSVNHYWEIMDVWATRAVALPVMCLLGHGDHSFSSQTPNDGFISGLDDHVFVEAWGHAVDGRFERFPIEVPPFIKHLVIHNNMGNALMADALAEQNYEKLCQAMMLRGDRTNFRYSMPSMRMVVADKWKLDDGLDDIYSRAILEKEPALEFEYLDFEEKKLLAGSNEYPWAALEQKTWGNI